MYSKPPEISQDIDTSNTQEGTQGIWHNLSDNEVKQAIFTSSSKKAPEPDGISFAIIQEAYKAIAEVINLVYKILIKVGFHPQCWREGTGVVLKKQRKPDYSLPKAYRIGRRRTHTFSWCLLSVSIRTCPPNREAKMSSC